MKVLITGANGFTGYYLVQYLQANHDIRLHCSSRKKNKRIEYKHNSYICDLTDYKSVKNLIQTVKPDQIYHLAGSFTNDYYVDYANNVLSSKNILDCLLQINPSCRVLLIGSAAEYGLVRESNNPIAESHPLNPVSAYGLTKVYQTHMMQFYSLVHNLDCVMARTFNLLGKDISSKLFVGNVYKQIEKYKNGEIKNLLLGNLDSKRDYIDVKKAVNLYEIIMSKGKRGEVYNVGSGFPIKLSELLREILLDNDLSVDIVHSKNIDYVNKININSIFADLSKVNLLF